MLDKPVGITDVRRFFGCKISEIKDCSREDRDELKAMLEEWPEEEILKLRAG